jgi:hypothetical protein
MHGQIFRYRQIRVVYEGGDDACRLSDRHRIQASGLMGVLSPNWGRRLKSPRKSIMPLMSLSSNS